MESSVFLSPADNSNQTEFQEREKGIKGQKKQVFFLLISSRILPSIPQKLSFQRRELRQIKLNTSSRKKKKNLFLRHSPGTSNHSKIRTRLQPLLFKTSQKPLPHVPAGPSSLLPCAPLSLLKFTYRMGGSALDSRAVLSSLASLGLSLSRYIVSSLAYKAIIHDLVDIIFRTIHSKKIFLVWVFKATFYSIEFTFDPGFAY